MPRSEMKNSPLGPSSCEQFWNCPASVQLQQNLPNESSDYATEGTNAHSLAAYCLQKRIDPRTLIDEEMEDGDNIWTVTEDMAEAVCVYWDAILAVIKEHGCRELFIERKMANPSIHELAFGTCDCFFISEDNKLFVFDYKHGRGVAVDAEGNKQMMYYAALAADYPFVDEIVLTIIQPRAKDEDTPIKMWVAGVDEVVDFASQLKEKMLATEEKNPPAQTGKWCKFCRAKFKCPAYTKTMTNLFPPEAQKEELLPDLPLEKYGELYNRAIVFKDRFDAWFKQLEGILYRFAEAGTPAPGTKMVKGRKTRRWADEKAAEKAFSEYGEQIYAPKKLKSPAQMEKVIDPDEVAELVEETHSLKLASESDKREEVKSIEQMFDVIEE